MKTITFARTILLASLWGTAGAILLPSAIDAVPTAHAASSVAGLPDFSDLVERTGGAVVNIRTTERVKPGQQGMMTPEDEEMQEFFRRFFGVPMPRPQPQPSPRGRRPSPGNAAWSAPGFA